MPRINSRRETSNAGGLLPGELAGVIIASVLVLSLLICAVCVVHTWIRRDTRSHRRASVGHLHPHPSLNPTRRSTSMFGFFSSRQERHRPDIELPLFNSHSPQTPSSGTEPIARHSSAFNRDDVNDFGRIPPPASITLSSYSTPRPSSLLMMEDSPTSIPFTRDDLNLFPPGLNQASGSRNLSPRRSPKSLPPLLIPDFSAPTSVSIIERLVAATPDTPPSTTQTSATSESLYSQPSAITSTANTRRRQIQGSRGITPPPPVPPLPQDTIFHGQALPPGRNLNGTPTKILAGLVKGRARRIGKLRSADYYSGMPGRSGTRVSRIERANSVASYDSGTSDEEEESNYATLLRSRRGNVGSF